MRGILFQYELNPTTWVYISSLLTIGIYFQFRRLWSLRNLDLIGLICFSPGLLLLYHGLHEQLAGNTELGRWLEQFGYVWLFSVGVFFLIRLLLDPIMVRRPLLKPNLTAGGLTFTGVSLLVFLMSNVVNVNPPSARDSAAESSAGSTSTGSSGQDATQRLEQALARQHVLPPANAAGESPQATAATHPGPGYPPLQRFAEAANAAFVPTPDDTPAEGRRSLSQAIVSRTVIITAHLMLLAGIVLIGHRHFDNIQTGVATASLYLLLPYAAQMTSQMEHVIPAALLVWAVVAYRWPAASGLLIGLAAGLIYYPLYLLPLWCSFYWRRGLIRFGGGVIAGLVLLVIALAFSAERFWPDFQQTFGLLNPLRTQPAGFWQAHEQVFRLPVLAAFVALSIGLALWPAQKNLGTLLSCSAAVMLGSQFWHANHGGVYMAWFLPLLLLTVFRPNLEDRVADTAVTEGWWRRRSRLARIDAANR